MRISISLGDDLMARLMKYARENGSRSIASIVREAIDRWLSQEVGK
jgi:metal-responsive CopG/Arc/MetJ family transcriptional regulator